MRTMKRLHQIIAIVAMTALITFQLGHAETNRNYNLLQTNFATLEKISEDKKLEKTLNREDLWPMPENFIVTKKIKKPDQADLDCLTLNIYYEAGSESFEGKAAVGLVTMNRVADTEFPNSVCKVVYQRVESICQFSWTCVKMKKPDYKSTAWTESKKIAKNLIERHPDLDLYRIKYSSVMYFHHKSVQPGWHNKMSRLQTAGENIFYRGRL